MTAPAMAGDPERCLAAGCTTYASKPIDRQRLIEACVGTMRQVTTSACAAL